MTGSNEEPGLVMNRTIVFFDGYCGLCSTTVDFLIQRDTGRRLLYSPLQGETAKLHLSEAERVDLDSVIVVVEASNSKQKYRQSNAILVALKAVGGLWGGLATGLEIVPIGLRDLVYRLIAKNRFRIIAKRSSCRVPTKEERALFLD